MSIAGWAGVETEGLANLERWIEVVGERPAVQRGRAVPQLPESEDDQAEIDPDKIADTARKMLV